MDSVHLIMQDMGDNYLEYKPTSAFVEHLPTVDCIMHSMDALTAGILCNAFHFLILTLTSTYQSYHQPCPKWCRQCLIWRCWQNVVYHVQSLWWQLLTMLHLSSWSGTLCYLAFCSLCTCLGVSALQSHEGLKTFCIFSITIASTIFYELLHGV